MDKRWIAVLIVAGVVAAGWLAASPAPTPDPLPAAADAVAPGVAPLGPERRADGVGLGQGLGPPDVASTSLAEAAAVVIGAPTWEALHPAWTGARCDPPPCVASLSYADQGDQSAAFRDAIYARFLEIGGGAQPSLVLEEPKAGRQRMWVVLVPNAQSAEESDAWMKQAAAHILADHGPDIR